MIGLLKTFLGWLFRGFAKLFRVVLFPWAKQSAKHAIAAGLVSAANMTVSVTTAHAKDVGAVGSPSSVLPSFMQARPGNPQPAASPASGGLGNFMSQFEQRGHESFS